MFHREKLKYIHFEIFFFEQKKLVIFGRFSALAPSFFITENCFIHHFKALTLSYKYMLNEIVKLNALYHFYRVFHLKFLPFLKCPLLHTFCTQNCLLFSYFVFFISKICNLAFQNGMQRFSMLRNKDSTTILVCACIFPKTVKQSN